MSRVNTLILEKFLLTLIPDKAKPEFSNAFTQFRSDRAPSLGLGITVIQKFFHDEREDVQVAAVNSLVIGMWMADCTQDDEFIKMFEGWLEAYKRFEGENVVDFMQARAGRPR